MTKAIRMFLVVITVLLTANMLIISGMSLYMWQSWSAERKDDRTSLANQQLIIHGNAQVAKVIDCMKRQVPMPTCLNEP